MSIFDLSKPIDYYSKDLGSIPKASSNVPSMPSAPSVPTPNSSWTPEINRYDQNFMKGGFLKKATDILSYPSMKTEQFLTGGKGYEQSVKNMTGVANTPGKLDWNDVGSFTGRLLLDPLNFIPIGKAANLVGKGLTKVPFLAKAASKIDDVAKTLKQVPIVDNLARKFVKGYGVPDNVVSAFDEIPTKFGKAVEPIIEGQKKLFKWGTGDQLSPDDIKAVAYFLEPQGAGKGIDLGALKAELGERFETVIRPILQGEKKINQQLIIDAIERGNIKSSEVAKELYNRAYLPHDFERTGSSFIQKARAMFDKNFKIPENTPGTSKYGAFGKKVGVQGKYWTKRKGAEGFITNVPEVMARRQMQQAKDNFIQEAIRKVRDEYGVKIGKGASVPEGFVIPTGTADRLRDLKGYAMPENIAKYLDETLKESAGWQRAMDRFNSVWKPLATSVNPGFHLTNMIGNMYNSFLGGVKNPKRYFQMVTGKFNDAEEAMIKGSGILQRGEFMTDAARTTFGSVKDKAFQTPQAIGGWVENNARKALFLDAHEKLVAKGLPHEEIMKQAAETVDKYLFDYMTGLTPFEQNVMKRLFPFYTWFRKNIPLQAESIVNQTGKPAAVLKAVKDANAGDMPDDLSIPAGEDDEGNALRYRIPLPIQDITTMSKPETARDMLNPVIKLLAAYPNWALSGGRQAPMDYWSGRELTNPDLPMPVQAYDIAKETGTSLVRPARTAQKISQNASAANILRSLMGGFFKDNSEYTFMNKVKGGKAKEKAVSSELVKSIKNNQPLRSKLLQQYQR